jgi:hypothetical protein
MQHCDARKCRRGAKSREENQRKDPTLAHTARMGHPKKQRRRQKQIPRRCALRMTTERLRARHGLHQGAPAGVPVPLSYLRRLLLRAKCALAARWLGRAIIFDLFPLGGFPRAGRSNAGGEP